MRPTLSWSDLPGRRVGLYGLGREGEAAVRACAARGISPVLVDDAPRLERVGGLPVLATDQGGAAALERCDVVVKSPGISRYAPTVTALEAGGVLVTGGLALWLQEADRDRVVCVTGTKGKSTTASIAAHLIRGLGHRCLLGGNIGVPPFDPQVAGDYDYWVIEVSSYQAADLTACPPVAALTSLNPDHLPWHRGDVETYYTDKLSLFRQPGARLTVANGDSELIRQRRAELGPQVRWVRSGDDPDAGWLARLGLLGAHNRRNALIAQALLTALGVEGAGDQAALERAAAGFAGLESRLQVIGTVGGVDFVDDGLSTNVLGTLAAVEAFAGRRVALIVGGQDRGIDYRPLADGLRERPGGAELLVLTIPDNGPRIHAELLAAGVGEGVEVRPSEGVAQAAGQGQAWAGPGGAVLLSPAAPSFGRFADYRERGAAFAAAMELLRPTGDRQVKVRPEPADGERG